MKTKLFFLIAIILTLAGLERGNAQELPDTVWTKQLELSQKVYVLKFSSDGQHFYAGINNYIAKYETMTGKLIYDSLMHGGQILSLDISSTGDTLLSSTTDGVVKLWNSETGKLLTTTPVVDEYDNKLFDANFFNNGHSLICRTTKDEKDTIPSFIIFNTKENIKLQEFGEEANARILRASPKNNYFGFTIWYTPYPQNPSKDYINLYSLKTYEKIGILGTHDNHVKDIEFSHDGRYIASGGYDGKVKIWDAETRELVKELTIGDIVWDIEFSKDDKYLLAGRSYDNNGSIWVFNIENGYNKIFEYKPPMSTGSVFDITPDSKNIISAGHFNVKGNHHIYLQLLNKKWTEVGIAEPEKPYEIIYPNPTNDIVNIVFSLTISSQIDLDLYDALGQFIQNIYTGYLEQGEQTIPFDASTLPAGLYFIRLNSPASTITYKLVKEG